jgi:[calcium/calmodulin-dependent protein kinase] kinase
MNIAHRDLKPQNLLIDADDEVKLIDFGEAGFFKAGTDLLRGSAGTHHFMAPEVCKRVKEEGYSGKQADIWSLGCTIYTMAFLIPPINGDSLMDLFNNIAKGE